MEGMCPPLRSVGLATEEDWYKHKKSQPRSYSDLLWKDSSQWCENRISNTGSRYPDFQHNVTKESVWYNPSWVGEDLGCRGLALSSGELYRKNDTSMALPAGCQDEGTAFVALLKACTKNKDLYRGTRLHDDILKRGLLEKCSDALIIMYAKCGELRKAKVLLDMHKSTNVITWTALIAGYTREGRGRNALDCFEHMQREGIPPNAVTYICILKACAIMRAVEMGKEIHDNIARQGLLQNNIVLGTALVDMYAKFGALSKAQDVLEKLPSRDVVSWNVMIAGCAQEGQGEQALNCFERMQCEGIRPDAVTYICILKACTTIGAIDKGKEIHDNIVRQGLLQNNIMLGNALVDMYAKCGALSKAQDVLEKLPSRNVVSWNALITGYAQDGQGVQALKCFERMQHEGIPPDGVTYICILKACASIGAIEKGKEIQDSILRHGLLQNNIVLGNALVDMYAKCGALSKAQDVLEKLPSWNVVSWSALIAGYAQEGQGEQALNCFECMQREGIPPDAVTYVYILKACAAIGAIDKGKEIHDNIVRHGLLLKDNIVLGNALVDMYAKCGALSKAQDVLEKLPSRDVVCWSTLIAGYAQEGQAEQALDCFKRMQGEGIHPDAVTFVCVLNMCSHLGLVEEGHALFVDMSTKYGVNPTLECYTCIVDLFGRAGHLEKAVQLIQEMPSCDYSAIWLALLGACRKWGDINVGRWAFEQAILVDRTAGPAYVLMADIYAAAGMQENAKNIETMRIRNKAWKKPGCSWWVDSSKRVHVFSVGDTTHAQSKGIYSKLEDLAHKMSQQGYSPRLHWVSPNISNAAKAHLLCRHSEKLALACALINTRQGEIICIQKNMRMCGDCHVATSLISRIEKRTIVVMDANFRHCFEDGNCSCNDYL